MQNLLLKATSLPLYHQEDKTKGQKLREKIPFPLNNRFCDPVNKIPSVIEEKTDHALCTCADPGKA